MQKKQLLKTFAMLGALSCLFNSLAYAKLAAKDYKDWLGPQVCAECHEDEAAIWKNSHHFTSFKKMPRSKDARSIKNKMNVKRIKTDKTCSQCHFTYVVSSSGTRVKPVAGTSCETCHGPAKNWNAIHDNYGGKDVKASQESKAHKIERWKKSDQAGMVRRAHPYKIFSQCYQCHTVPNEKLVNIGGHTAGSKFELVSWLSGEVRHNVWYSKGKVNKLSSKPKQRILFVLGKTLDLQYALRGLAKATKDGKYATAMAKRAQQATMSLTKINNAHTIPEIKSILVIMRETPLDYQHGEKLNASADKIATLTQQFIANNDGKQLGALDTMIPKKYKGKPVR